MSGRLADLEPPWSAGEYLGLFFWKKVCGQEVTASETCEVEKKVGKWEEMLVVFYRNYVMWFQGTKESLRPDDYPKGYVRLDKSRLENIRVREDVSGIWPKREEVQNCFGVFHTEVKDSFGVFRCHSSSQYDRMYGHLGKYMSEVQRAAKDLHRFGNDLDKLVKVVKMPMRLECNVNGSRVKEWTEKMVGLRDLYKEWSPNLQKFKMFVELYHERTQDYIDWFTASGAGFKQEVTDAEDKQLKHWKDSFGDLEKVKAKVQAATEQSFFKEDFKPTVLFCEEQLAMLDGYNSYKMNVLKSARGSEFPELQEKLHTLIKFLQSFPTAGEVELWNGFSKGVVKVKDVVWEFEHMPKVAENHVEIRAQKNPDMHPFFTVGGFEIVSEDFGSVLWNRSSWVWYHPQVPFVIRYDFKKADQLFSFHGYPKGKKSEKAQHGTMPHWKFNGKNALQPVLPSGIEMNPLIKGNFASAVLTEGSVPLPVMMLMAMMTHIRYVTQELFGYGGMA